MKVRASVKRLCGFCKVVKRRGIVFIQCKSNLKHKQRQGFSTIAACLPPPPPPTGATVSAAAFAESRYKKLCQRASWVKEVARECWPPMLAELNAHCEIPLDGSRVKFVQYVQEKTASFPHSSSSSSQRGQPPL